MKLIKYLILFLVPSFVMATELADNSVYNIESNWRNQNNQQLEISELQGHVQIVAFIYTYCEHTCPTIISKLKQIKKKIPDELHDQVRLSLISLDPGRDTPQILKSYMEKNALDESKWTLLNGQSDDVLEFAALFGVRYKPMGESDIAHSNMITVLDKDGVIRYQMKGLNESVANIVKEIELAASSADS